MNLTQLHALSPLDGRYSRRVDSLRTHFSEFALMKYRVIVEVRYLIFFLQHTKLQSLSDSDIKGLESIVSHFDDQSASQIKEHEQVCHHDVKAVEYFLQDQLKAQGLERLIPYVHFGLTSEDVNSCAHGLALTDANQQVVIPAVQKLIESLIELATNSAKSVMMAKTHGQPAVPTTLGKELIVFATRLEKIFAALSAQKIEAKLGGAVGNWNAVQFVLPDEDWLSFAEKFLSNLGLQPNTVTTQIVPAESYSEYFQILVRCNSILIDLSRDCWQYISDEYLLQQINKNQVGSSTMPQKVNPIDFENAEGNAGMAVAVLQHFIEKLPISRLQRDLSDSTVKRSFGVALGHTVLALQSLTNGLSKVSPNHSEMQKVVEHHPEVLAEALQTALRMSGQTDAYEQIKEKTRGKKVTTADMQKLSSVLKNDTLKQRYSDLKPETYSGLAAHIVATESKRIQQSIKNKKTSTTIRKG